MESALKPTKRQQQVLDLMRDGWVIKSHRDRVWLQKGDDIKTLSSVTRHALAARGLIVCQVGVLVSTYSLAQTSTDPASPAKEE